MAYRFKLNEDLQHGVRRIAVEQIEKALAAPHGKTDRPVWVHETRKCLKRTRSLLRLVREGLGERAWRDHNSELRRIANKLGGLRDSHVAHETLRTLAAGGDADFQEASAWLEQRLGKGTDRKVIVSNRAAAGIVTAAIGRLEKARDRLAKVDVSGELTSALAGGVAQTQRTSRTALLQLQAEPTDEHLHELRKAVQTYQRQQALVQAAWPELQGIRVETARACAQLLGEAQDLAVLAGLAKQLCADGNDDDRDHADRLVEACQARQAEIRRRAVPVARRLLATKPKAAARDFTINWGAAVKLAAIGEDAVVPEEPPAPAVPDRVAA